MDQLLSPESLRKTGYFDTESVQYWRQAYRTLRPGSLRRTSVEMGLVAVTATQLWHQTFIDSSLADLPSYKVEGGGWRVESERRNGAGAATNGTAALHPPPSTLHH